jgi:hypothetical protein
MTMSEFDLLRADLAGVRTDLDGFRGDLAGLRSDVDRLRVDMDIGFARLEAKIDEKPSAATTYQASLTTFAGMFAVVIGAIIALKTLSIIP